ncbi:MAG: site-specific DNA-methyltransferase [Chloroflexota bacterium]|nr:site-specific DNA-methyltransferase [Chloroflexota bacterium]MDE2909935.1 site-specific DNA-methyltransferase [Chloroflexota bacterium]
MQNTLWDTHLTEIETEPMIENVDCRLGMTGLSSNSVSLILTDPPYFIDGMGSDWNTTKLRRRVKPGVVGALPAGMKFSPQQAKDLENFLSPIAQEWMRIIRPGAFCLVFSQNRLAHRSTIALENAGFEIRDTLLWKYEGQAKAFTQDHFVRKSSLPEDEKKRLITKLGGRKTPQLKPQGETIILAQAPREGTFVENWDKWETGLIDVSDPLVDTAKFPGTVIPVPKTKERYGHMTAKPVILLRHLIRIFCAPKALVLDPFSGSGSTGVACLYEGRNFLGYEIETEMAKVANRRLKEML